MLIGTSILKVVASAVGSSTPNVPQVVTPTLAGADTRNSYDIDGGLDEISVLELLEMYGVPEREAIIELDSPDGAASVTVAAGRLQACAVDSLPASASLAKRTFRFMSCAVGRFPGARLHNA